MERVDLGTVMGRQAPERCTCCDNPEPQSGWYAFSVTGDPELDDRYCSQACFAAHEDRACGCFVDDEMVDLYGEEEP